MGFDYVDHPQIISEGLSPSPRTPAPSSNSTNINDRNKTATQKLINSLCKEVFEGKEVAEEFETLSKNLLKRYSIRQIGASEKAINDGTRALTLTRDQKNNVIKVFNYHFFGKEEDKKNLNKTIEESDVYRARYMQHLSHGPAYYDYHVGEEIPYFRDYPVEEGNQGSSKVKFVVHDIIQDENGFHAMIVMPEQLVINEDGKLKARPMLIFRGTSCKSDLQEDFARDLGKKGIEKNLDKIKASMESCKQKLLEAVPEDKKRGLDVRFDIAGHSLGGNRAQRFTAKHPEMVHVLFTCQSPGVGKAVVEEYSENCKKLEKKPKIVRIITSSDIVTKAGGEHLPETYIHAPEAKSKNPLTVHNDRSLLRQSKSDRILVNQKNRGPSGQNAVNGAGNLSASSPSGLRVQASKPVSKEGKSDPKKQEEIQKRGKTLEGLRKKFGPFLRFITRLF